MTIFDGVPVKPTLSPTMQGVLSMVVLVANSIAGAEKCRQERLAGGEKRPTTLEDVMEKSGLKIPGIHEALSQLMGGTEEAKKAASLIVNTPDPASLLRQFAEQFGCGMPANTGPIVTPPPAGPASPPTPAGPASPPTPAGPASTPAASSGLPKYRPDFTREAREAAKADANAPASPLPKYRPDFTREAREAAKGAAASAAATAAPPAGAQDRPSLVSMVDHQLGVLRRRMKAQYAELDARLKRAEAELAKLRQELHDLRAAKGEPAHVVVAPAIADEPASEMPEAAQAVDEPSPVAVADEPGTMLETAQTIDEPPMIADVARALPESGAEPELPLPAAASEQEVVRAVELISEFTDEVDEHHQQSLERIVAVEQEVSVMRALVEHERRAAGAAAHG